MNENNLAGIDEAGRGPVLGPLVIAGVVLSARALEQLVILGLKDSKLLSASKREQLHPVILETAIAYKVVTIPASEIDEQRAKGISLNVVERECMINILSSLRNWSIAYVDACDRKTGLWQQQFQDLLQKKVVVEHFADINYPVVSAASILAKVARDEAIRSAQEEYGVDFGSGYPSDPKTCQFLKDYFEKNGKLPIIARKSWETSKKILCSSEQKKIADFFSPFD